MTNFCLGRTGPGVCFRLYSEDDYTEFSQYSTPEIHRVPLDSLVLQMASLGLHDATLFPFIEPPQKSHLVNAIHFLKDQNALTNEGILTSLGEMLARLPVDICVGKMLIMGCLFSLVEPVLVIAAALSVQSPLTRKFGVYDDTEHRRREYFSPHGDPFTLLNVYDEWVLIKSDRRHSSASASKKWCKRRGFEEQRFYEISKLKRQFEDILRDHNLLQKSNSRQSVAEKTERRRLVKLKREHGSSNRRRKRKVLKMETDYDVENSASSSEDSDVDLNDLDFKLRHDLSKLEASSKKNRRFTIRDVNLLKLIVSSGLFPQVAIPDESNVWRKQTEQVYHCKDKQFLLLHPTSVYSLQPELLDSLYANNDDKPGSSASQPEGRYTNLTEFLIYVSLLETNKPYVVNTMKIPALQTLFLLSNSIDTNSDFTKILFNEWIELTFEFDKDDSQKSEKKESSVEKLLSNVVQLRKNWETLLEQKLLLNNDVTTEDKDCSDKKMSEEKLTRLSRIRKLEDEASLQLAGFIDTSIQYKIRRLTSADTKHLYVGFVDTVDENSAQHTGTPSTSGTLDVTQGIPNKTKGGVMITPYLTYSCLKDELSMSVAAGEAEFLRQHYHCAKCEQHLICTVVERMQHDEVCGLDDKLNATTDDVLDEASEMEETNVPSTRVYFCKECDKELKLTSIDILRHKKSHC